MTEALSVEFGHMVFCHFLTGHYLRGGGRATKCVCVGGGATKWEGGASEVLPL